MERPKYSRVVLKLSGEALAGERGFGVDIDTVRWIAGQVSEAYALGTQLAIVVGGGNIWRGSEASRMGMDRSSQRLSPSILMHMPAICPEEIVDIMTKTKRITSFIISGMAPTSPERAP